MRNSKFAALRPLGTAAVLLALALGIGSRPALAQPIDGRRGVIEDCDNFSLGLPTIFGFLDTYDFPDPAWVRVGKKVPSLARFRSATGLVAENPKIGDYPADAIGDEAVINWKDFPDVHDSHDMNFYLLLDPTPLNNGIVSTFGLSSSGKNPGEEGYVPDTLEVEWETGILTSRTTGDGLFFPKSMWPVPGDRVWVNGYWIFDCGHAPENASTHEKGLRTEIHPPRAVATMRQQVAIPPATIAPIPSPIAVTAVDLYIHGRAGIIVDLLECGGDVILYDPTCPTRTGQTPRGSDSDDGDPSHDIARDHLGMPIDVDFDFVVCTPKRPAALGDDANPIAWAPEGPGVEPDLTTIEAAGIECADTSRYGPKQIRVNVRLAGSGLTPDDVYSRQIYVGWAAPPVAMRRIKVTLDSMLMNDDTDHDSLTIGDDDCECSWFWMHVDRAPDEWRRLSDHVVNDPEHMNDFRDGTSKAFSNATWDFLVQNDRPFVMRAFGFDGGVGEDASSLSFDQDCLDDHFAHHDLGGHINLLPPFAFTDLCYLGVSLFGQNNGNDDPFDIARREVTAENITGFFGAWPSTGSVPLTFVSVPLWCRATLEPFGIVLRLRCESAEQVRQAFEDAGVQVRSVEEYHQYELRTTIESLPADSDGDGLTDQDEVSTHHTDPLDGDTDNDGLTDGAEVNTHHTDPLDADTDDDELSDGAEVNTHHTDPLDSDTDDDLLPDGVEVATGMDPLDTDTDNDGTPDGRDPQFIINAVQALPELAFRTEGNRTAILGILAAIEERIKNGNVAQAIRDLQNLRTFLNGCGTSADGNDWIVDCPAQLRIRRYVDLLLTNLGA